MKFPLLSGEITAYPDKAKCPICKKKKVFEPHSMAILSGGALYAGQKRGIPDKLEGFAHITWHGAHDTGIGADRDIYTGVELARDTSGGQFEIYFCSTACMRKFFNQWVDVLEAKVKAEKKKKG